MDEKKLEQEYRKLMRQSAPDLWSRIESGLDESPRREPVPVLQEEKKRKRSLPYGMAAAAAAVVLIAAGVRGVQGDGGEMPWRAMNKAAALQETRTAATTAAAPEADMDMMAEMAPSEAGVVYSSGESLDFSEDMLADTAVLCKAAVDDVSFEYDSAGNAAVVVYKVAVQELCFVRDGVEAADILEIKSPVMEAGEEVDTVLYQLQPGENYLLPIKEQDGAWELLFPFTPQIQITDAGGYLFHSGYESLVTEETVPVKVGQEGVNDTFFDRMLLREDKEFLDDLIALIEQKQ